MASTSKKTHPDSEEVRALSQNEQRSRVLIENCVDIIAFINAEGIVTYVSSAITPIMGYSSEEIVGSHAQVFVHPDDRNYLQQTLEEIGQAPGKSVHAEYRCRCKDGSWRWFEGSGTNLLHVPSIGAIVSNFRDMTDRKQIEALLEGQQHVLEMVAHGTELQDALEVLVRVIEKHSRDEMLASILLLDEDGVHLRHGAAPSLPISYNQAVDGIAIGPAAVSCGTAVYRGEATYVSDIATDPLWAEYKALALPHGLRACWSTPIRASNGQILGTLALYYRQPRHPSVQDRQLIDMIIRAAAITIERKQAEQERMRLLSAEQAARAEAEVARQRLYDLFMQAPASICLLRGKNHVFELANPLYFQLVGQRDLIGKSAREALPELERQGFFELLDQVYATGKPFIGNEIRAKIERHHKGTLTEGFFNFVYQASRNNKGEVDGILVHAFEITEQVYARRQLKESEARLRFMAESMPQKIFTAKPNGDIDYFNQQWMQFTGLSFKEIKAWGWTQFIHPDDVEENVKCWKHSLETGEPFYFEHRFRHADGVYCWHISRATPMRDDQGKIMQWIGSSTDINEQKQLEERKDDFISMASHELKTPITSLKGFAQLLQRRFKKQADEESLRFLTIMDTKLNKLTNLINDLLDISKMQQGKLDYREEHFELAQLVQESMENLQAATDTHQLCLESRTEAQVCGDRDRIEQVLTNLLTNAIKYSPKADTVIVRVAKDQDQENAIVSVQDFGIGITLDHHKQIFERFYQVTDSEEKTYPGLGMGLYISHEIIERHHGRIWVESRKGVGSTFSFSLPVRGEAGHVILPPSNSPAPQAKG